MIKQVNGNIFFDTKSYLRQMCTPIEQKLEAGVVPASGPE